MTFRTLSRTCISLALALLFTASLQSCRTLPRPRAHGCGCGMEEHLR